MRKKAGGELPASEQMEATAPDGSNLAEMVAILDAKLMAGKEVDYAFLREVCARCQDTKGILTTAQLLRWPEWAIAAFAEGTKLSIARSHGDHRPYVAVAMELLQSEPSKDLLPLEAWKALLIWLREDGHQTQTTLPPWAWRYFQNVAQDIHNIRRNVELEPKQKAKLIAGALGFVRTKWNIFKKDENEKIAEDAFLVSSRFRAEGLRGDGLIAQVQDFFGDGDARTTRRRIARGKSRVPVLPWPKKAD